MQATTTENTANGLIGRLIGASARNPWLTLVFAAALGVWGWMSMRGAPLDAIPDLSDVQVIIQTDWAGQEPGLVEDQITYPISSALLAAPQVKFVRGQSFDVSCMRRAMHWLAVGALVVAAGFVGRNALAYSHAGAILRSRYGLLRFAHLMARRGSS